MRASTAFASDRRKYFQTAAQPGALIYKGVPVFLQAMCDSGAQEVAVAARAVGGLMLTSIDAGRQRELLRGLQLTRDFLRTLQAAPGLMPNNANFFVRLNMGSRYFLYVAAQIVQINGDELQVRGVDPNQPHFIQRTKLAYVSNAIFKDEELLALTEKLRCGVISDLRVGEVEEMVGLRMSVVQHPHYPAIRRAQQEQHQAAAALPPHPLPLTAHMLAMHIAPP